MWACSHLAACDAADVQPIVVALFHVLLHPRVGDVVVVSERGKTRMYTITCVSLNHWHPSLSLLHQASRPLPLGQWVDPFQRLFSRAFLDPNSHPIPGARNVPLLHGPMCVVHGDPLSGREPQPDLLLGTLEGRRPDGKSSHNGPHRGYKNRLS